MILPTGLYACEIWDGLSNTEIAFLEWTQRYAARFIQCMDKASPIDSCSVSGNTLFLRHCFLCFICNTFSG
jgi:hypothetical protein